MENSYLEIIKKLDRFASSFSRINTLEDLILATESILEDTFRVVYTGLYLFDPSENRLKLMYAKGFSEEEWSEAENTSLERHPGLVYNTGEMIYIADTFLDERELTRSSKRSFEVRSRLYIPVKNGEKVVGAIGIVDPKPNAYAEEDIAILSFICNLAGAIYGNILNQNLLHSAHEQITTLSKLPAESPNPVMRISNEAILLYANSNEASQEIMDFHGLQVGKPVSSEIMGWIHEALQQEKAVEKDLSVGRNVYSFILTPVKEAGYLNLYGREITEQKEIENELRKMALIARETGNAVIITNKTGEIEWVNEAFTKVFEYTLDEVEGLKPGRFLQGEETNPATVVQMSEAIRNRKEIEVDIINYSKSHKKFWVNLQIQPVFDADGELINYISIEKDITNEKAIEQELIRTTTFQKALLNSAAIAIFSTDLNGIIRSFNPAASRMLGYQAEEVTGIHTPHLFHDENELQSHTTGGKRMDFSELRIFNFDENSNPEDITMETGEFNFVRKNGSKFPVSLTVTALRGEHNQINGFIALAEDITLRKAADKNLRKLSQAVEQSPVMTYITDLTGRIEFANPKVSQITGYSMEELLGETPRVFSSNEKSKAEYAEIWDTISSGKEWKGEFHNKMKNGEYFWVMASISPVYDQEGNIVHFIAVEEDITRSKEQYDALQIANLRFRLLISSMQAGVMVEDEHRRVLLVNQLFCDLFSIPVPPEVLTGANCAEAAEASKGLFKDPGTFIRDIESTLNMRKAVTNFELQMASGLYLERDFIPIEDLGRQNRGILWIYRDITKRKNNERDLLRQSKILSGTALAMNYLLTLPDHDLAIRKSLEAIGLATGVERVYILGNNPDPHDGQAYFNQLFEWAAEGTPPQIDDQTFHQISFNRHFPDWYEMLMSGKPIAGLVNDFPKKERKLLQKQNILSIILVPVFVNGQLWGMIGLNDSVIGIEWSPAEISILTALAASVGGSISRRIIENELINARQIAEYATKTKSEFLATMSHEIRTPMNGVIGMTSLLMQTPLQPDQLEYAETIRVSGELLLNLINDILDFSKIESGKMVLEEQNFDLQMAIEDVLDLMGTVAFEKRLGLYFEISPEVPRKITGDLTRLRQILVNLTGNAIKFTSEGEVVIRVSLLERKASEMMLLFSVKDTGLGIPKGKIDILFKPFSQVDASTTRKYGGTGLGLAICGELVKLMKGKIWVESGENQGSEFKFTIKTACPPTEVRAEILLPVPSILRGKNILIADANLTSSAILNTLFEEQEMKAQCIYSAEQALELLSERKDFDIMLIDDSLFDMDINLLAVRIKQTGHYTHLPLLLATYPTFKENGTKSDLTFNVRINKPLKHSQLISHVTALLSGAETAPLQNIKQRKPFQKINELYPLNILVAEDNSINQKLISRLFELLGYNIHVVANGFEVLDALHQLKIDLIFMDIQMPEMDGLEATRQIISRWGNQRPVIVAMTANALETDREQCLAAGMDDYMSKPLNIELVIKGIEKWSSLSRSPARKRPG